MTRPTLQAGELAPDERADVQDTLERFERLRLLLSKLTAISQLVHMLDKPHADEVRVLCAQAGMLAIDLTQSGMLMEPVAEMIAAWSSEQMQQLKP